MLPSEKRKARRTGLAAAVRAASNSSTKTRLRTARLFRVILALGDVDHLSIGQPIRGAEALAIASHGLAADFVRGDLRASLDDDLAFPLRAGLHHRHLAFGVHEV